MLIRIKESLFNDLETFIKLNSIFKYTKTLYYILYLEVLQTQYRQGLHSLPWDHLVQFDLCILDFQACLPHLVENMNVLVIYCIW